MYKKTYIIYNKFKYFKWVSTTVFNFAVLNEWEFRIINNSVFNNINIFNVSSLLLFQKKLNDILDII